MEEVIKNRYEFVVLFDVLGLLSSYPGPPSFPAWGFWVVFVVCLFWLVACLSLSRMIVAACTGCAAKMAHASATGINLFIFLIFLSSFSFSMLP